MNSYYWLRSDRARQQVNATVTKFASGFAGQHSLKFGAEFERSRAKNEVGYPGGGYIVASYGVPYYAYLGGDYLQDATNNRMSLFVQDSWAIGRRLTITPGLRFDRYRGSLAVFDEDIYKTTAWGPRIGFAYDMFASGRTVIRGHYGRYFDGAKSNYYNLVNGTEPQFGAYIDPVSLQPLHEPYLINPGSSIATVSDDLKQPRLDQFIIGFEHELFSNFAIGANGIFRDNNDFIEDVLVDPDFAPVPVADPGPDGTLGTADDTGRTLTFYNQLSDPADDRFFVTNPSEAFRRYRGLELTANKRFTDGWMLQGSWVISKITGNINNTSNQGNSVEYRRSQSGSPLPAFPRGTAGPRQHAHREGAGRRADSVRGHDVRRVLLHDRRDLHPDRSPKARIRERSICSPKNAAATGWTVSRSST